MSYTTIETAAVNVIKKNADFASYCKASDTKPLGKGISRFCLVSYNSDRTEELTIKVERRTWFLNVDIYVPWRGDLPELETRISTEFQKVKDILAKYPRLDACAGVLKSILYQGNAPAVLTMNKGTFRGKRNILEVDEAVDAGRVE